MPNEQVKYRQSAKNRTDAPRQFSVILHNDDFTTMEFVVEVLMKIFYKSLPEAETIMLTVHHKGSASVGRYSYDIACTKAARATEMARAANFPLRITVEPA
ncbi:MAG: ATP-dependent Clp protease adaptor ClpS [Muribaculaceae bacterium]|nr:ATP-dependent Clp protease adaptor ClpS [Muribaculaceae bacterium]MDE6753831.1 ATP-dependent Clp protease adaptor ClpS [Muribaculaceae bacterium]